MEDKILENEVINENNQPIEELNDLPVTENEPSEGENGETVFYFEDDSAPEESPEENLPTVEIDDNGAIVVEFGTDEDAVEEPVALPEVEPEALPEVEPEPLPEVEPEIEPEVEPEAEETPVNNDPTPEKPKKEAPKKSGTGFGFVPLTPANNKKKEKAPKPKKEKPVKTKAEPIASPKKEEKKDDAFQPAPENKKKSRKEIRAEKEAKRQEREKEKKAKNRKKNLISFILLLLLFAIPVGFLAYIIMAILSFFS